jgi:hypothetical protein
LLNPYQLSSHGRPGRCATSTRCLSAAKSSAAPSTAPFRSGVLPDCGRKPSPTLRGGRCIIGMGEAYMPQFGWSVGNPTYMEGFVRPGVRFRGRRLK